MRVTGHPTSTHPCIDQKSSFQDCHLNSTVYLRLINWYLSVPLHTIWYVCIVATNAFGLFSTIWDLTLIAYVTTSSIFEDKSVYQTFARVSYSQEKIAIAVLDLLVYYNWTNFALVYWDN